MLGIPPARAKSAQQCPALRYAGPAPVLRRRALSCGWLVRNAFDSRGQPHSGTMASVNAKKTLRLDPLGTGDKADVMEVCGMPGMSLLRLSCGPGQCFASLRLFYGMTLFEVVNGPRGLILTRHASCEVRWLLHTACCFAVLVCGPTDYATRCWRRGRSLLLRPPLPGKDDHV